MDQTSGRLIEIRDLLERALEKNDALDNTFLGVVIDTALQEVNTKIAEQAVDN